eukprot:4661054-Pleurochrysis_carterae.AAC.1
MTQDFGSLVLNQSVQILHQTRFSKFAQEYFHPLERVHIRFILPGIVQSSDCFSQFIPFFLSPLHVSSLVIARWTCFPLIYQHLISAFNKLPQRILSASALSTARSYVAFKIVVNLHAPTG